MFSWGETAEEVAPVVSEKVVEPEVVFVPPIGAELPESVDVSFALVSHRPAAASSKTGLPELRIEGRNQDLTDEGLSEIMDFMDKFVWSEIASKGFCICYDLRQLKTPSMAIITRVAEWGKVPERKFMWEKLNSGCKIVVGAGLMFTMAKPILSTLFYLCPPVCPTFLLTDADEPEENAVCYRPPENEQEAASTAEGSSPCRSPSSSRSSSSDARVANTPGAKKEESAADSLVEKAE